MAQGLSDEMVNAIERIDSEWDGVVRTGCHYSPEADCVFVYNESVPYYRERVDDVLTVYRATVGGRIIGLQIKSVSRLEDVDWDIRTADGLPRRDVVVLLLRSFQRFASHSPASDVILVYAQAVEVAAQPAPEELASPC